MAEVITYLMCVQNCTCIQKKKKPGSVAQLIVFRLLTVFSPFSAARKTLRDALATTVQQDTTASLIAKNVLAISEGQRKIFAIRYVTFLKFR